MKISIKCQTWVNGHIVVVPQLWNGRSAIGVRAFCGCGTGASRLSRAVRRAMCRCCNGLAFKAMGILFGNGQTNLDAYVKCRWQVGEILKIFM